MMACLCANANFSFGIVKLLVEAGANVNHKNKEGWTALMNVCFNCNSISTCDIIKLLIKAGANVNTQNNDGYTALMWACRDNTAASIEL